MEMHTFELQMNWRLPLNSNNFSNEEIRSMTTYVSIEWNWADVWHCHSAVMSRICSCSRAYALSRHSRMKWNTFDDWDNQTSIQISQLAWYSHWNLDKSNRLNYLHKFYRNENTAIKTVVSTSSNKLDKKIAHHEN